MQYLLDSQGNASAAVGLIIENDEPTLKDLILEKGQAAEEDEKVAIARKAARSAGAPA